MAGDAEKLIKRVNAWNSMMEKYEDMTIASQSMSNRRNSTVNIPENVIKVYDFVSRFNYLYDMNLKSYDELNNLKSINVLQMIDENMTYLQAVDKCVQECIKCVKGSRASIEIPRTLPVQYADIYCKCVKLDAAIWLAEKQLDTHLNVIAYLIDKENLPYDSMNVMKKLFASISSQQNIQMVEKTIDKSSYKTFKYEILRGHMTEKKIKKKQKQMTQALSLDAEISSNFVRKYLTLSRLLTLMLTNIKVPLKLQMLTDAERKKYDACSEMRAEFSELLNVRNKDDMIILEFDTLLKMENKTFREYIWQNAEYIKKGRETPIINHIIHYFNDSQFANQYIRFHTLLATMLAQCCSQHFEWNILRDIIVKENLDDNRKMVNIKKQLVAWPNIKVAHWSVAEINDHFFCIHHVDITCLLWLAVLAEDVNKHYNEILDMIQQLKLPDQATKSYTNNCQSLFLLLLHTFNKNE